MECQGYHCVADVEYALLQQGKELKNMNTNAV